MLRRIAVLACAAWLLVTGCATTSHVRAANDAPTPWGASCASSCQALPNDRQYDCIRQCKGAIVVFGRDCGRPDPRTVCIARREEPSQDKAGRQILGGVGVGLVVLTVIGLYALHSYLDGLQEEKDASYR